MAVWKSMNRRVAITYCIGIMLDAGLVLASDSRTHAGVDNFASFCKVSVFERAGDRVIILLSSGNLATPRLSGS
jgi:putative proteasome-type protease